MTTAKSRHDELVQSFLDFHRDNPIVFDLFCQFTMVLIRRGFQHGGAKMVMERVRWESAFAGQDGHDQFKINNNHAAFYARAFMNCYPEHDGFFRLRRQHSKDEPAVRLPELRPSYWDRTGQGDLF